VAQKFSDEFGQRFQQQLMVRMFPRTSRLSSNELLWQITSHRVVRTQELPNMGISCSVCQGGCGVNSRRLESWNW